MKLTAGFDAAEAGTRAASLASELETMFLEFKSKCLAAMQGGWSGLTPEALENAQHAWVTKAQGLSDALARSGTTVTQNVNNLLDVDDAFARRLRASGA